MSDTQIFWDWVIFGFAIFLGAPFCLSWLLPKLHVNVSSRALYRTSLLTGALSILLPTQFPLLWRIYWGRGPIVADLHLIELNQQVAVGTLCALAVLLYLLADALIRVMQSNTVSRAAARHFAMLRRLGHFWTNGDAV